MAGQLKCPYQNMEDKTKGCEYATTDMKVLLLHKREVHTNQVYHCPYSDSVDNSKDCEYNTTNVQLLLMHKRVHTNQVY